MKNIITASFVMALVFGVAHQAQAGMPGGLVCEEGYYIENVLIVEAVPEVEEVSHIVIHEAVTEEVVTCEKVEGGKYIDGKCKIKALDWFPGQRFDKITSTVVVKEAYEEIIIDVPYSPEIPAVYEDQCVKMEEEEEEEEIVPEVPPTPEPARGGGGKCMNCDTSTSDTPATTVAPVAPVTPVAPVKTAPPVKPMVPATPACPALIEGFIKIGANNAPRDVIVLQTFLGRPVTGYYSYLDYLAVKDFQNKHASDILSPWHFMIPGMGATGYVYQTTRWKINKILCPEKAGAFPVLM
jgi:hypothetical protein